MQATLDPNSHHVTMLAFQELVGELDSLLQYELVVDISMMHGLGTAAFEVQAIPEQIRHALADGSGRLMGHVDDACSVVTRLQGLLANLPQPS